MGTLIKRLFKKRFFPFFFFSYRWNVKTVDEIIMSKNYLAFFFMALSRASTAFLKFGTVSADVSGRLGIF